MSLVADYGDSSNSESSNASSDSDSEIENIQTKEPRISSKNKLPAPTFGNTNNLPQESSSSVFKNRFTEAESAKEAILQKHVKMVEAKDNVVVINGKKICWNYRKGKCRFGHTCKYAHDSDIQKTKAQIETEKADANLNSVICQSLQNPANPKYVNTENGSDDEDTISKNKHKRKRPGLTQGLIPSKKVMKQYSKHKT